VDFATTARSFGIGARDPSRRREN